MSTYGATDRNLPTITNSAMQKGRTSSFNVYKKPAVGLWVLEDMLGEKLFNLSLQNYIKNWKGKHPMPYDFFNVVNTTSGENYNWFWEKWFFENAHADLRISNVSENKIYINKLGGLPVPVVIKITYDDKSNETLTFKADIWKDKIAHVITVSSKNKITKIALGNDYIPDTNKEDNHWSVDE
jgi:aminopeptidase N